MLHIITKIDKLFYFEWPAISTLSYCLYGLHGINLFCFCMKIAVICKKKRRINMPALLLSEFWTLCSNNRFVVNAYKYIYITLGMFFISDTPILQSIISINYDVFLISSVSNYQTTHR